MKVVILEHRRAGVSIGIRDYKGHRRKQKEKVDFLDSLFSSPSWKNKNKSQKEKAKV